MSDETRFVDLMARLRRGDGAAASLIFDQYANRLIGLARRRLDGMLRRKVDPEDVVQSVFRSFFQRQADGRMEVGNWDSLWGMLVVITLRKCGRAVEYFRAARRDVHREAAPRADREDFGPGWEAMADDPTPSEAAMLAETVENLMRSLDPRDRQILELSLQGSDAQHISAQVGCTERTVYRVLERVKERLQGWQAESAEA
jgi:RNA polymerase sigma-70 factor, ECF subfamily